MLELGVAIGALVFIAAATLYLRMAVQGAWLCWIGLGAMTLLLFLLMRRHSER